MRHEPILDVPVIDPIQSSARTKYVLHQLEVGGRFRVSNLYTLVQSIVCLGAYAGLAWFASTTTMWPLLLPCWCLQAFLIAGYLGASHDCAHRVHYTNPTANRIAGALWAATASVNFTLYKHFHLDHHRYVGTDEDTEPAGEFDSLGSYLSSLPTIHFFMTFWRMSAFAALGRFPHFIRSEPQRRAVLFDDVVLLAAAAVVITLLVFHPRMVGVAYLVPLALSFPMVFLFSLPEHYGCRHTSDWRLNTRSMTSNPVTSYFYWNGNYHADHHVFPRVPSRYLPRVHALMRGEFMYSGGSYLMFHVALLRHLCSASARAPLEEGVVKVLSPKERIHFEHLIDQVQTGNEVNR